MNINRTMAKSCADRLNIVVGGYLVRCPIGGMAWHHLQYLVGLKQLGHNVVFIEDSDDTPWCCYDPLSGNSGTDPTAGIAFLERIMPMFGLEHWAYHDAHQECWLGPSAETILKYCKEADLYLDLSLANPVRPWTAGIKKRAGIGTDPVFNQVRNLSDPKYRLRSKQHHVLFTFAETAGLDCSTVPDDGFYWHPTRQPVVVDLWPVEPINSQAPFTTVMQWDSYSRQAWDGRTFGMKAESFIPFLGLPMRTSVELELALGSKAAPREQLRSMGWRIRDPISVTLDPWDYQRYLIESQAEFAIAKQGYVSTRSGWFSERSANYLASGRPVVMQETGFSKILPCGKGLFAFTDIEEAEEALIQVARDPVGQGKAARDIAVQYFDSDHVLTQLLSTVFTQS